MEQFDSLNPEEQDEAFHKLSPGAQKQLYGDTEHETSQYTEVLRAIRDRGGLKPFRETTGETVESEEYHESVPLVIRRKNGMAPDDMALSLSEDFPLESFHS